MLVLCVGSEQNRWHASFATFWQMTLSLVERSPFRATLLLCYAVIKCHCKTPLSKVEAIKSTPVLYALTCFILDRFIYRIGEKLRLFIILFRKKPISITNETFSQSISIFNIYVTIKEPALL